MKLQFLFASALVLVTACAHPTTQALPAVYTGKCPPATPQIPVTDEYHGVKVTDPYRWLENTDAPEVEAWTHAQTDCARRYLDQLSEREKIRAKLQTWNDFQSSIY